MVGTQRNERKDIIGMEERVSILQTPRLTFLAMRWGELLLFVVVTVEFNGIEIWRQQNMNHVMSVLASDETSAFRKLNTFSMFKADQKSIIVKAYIY